MRHGGWTRAEVCGVTSAGPRRIGFVIEETSGEVRHYSLSKTDAAWLAAVLSDWAKGIRPSPGLTALLEEAVPAGFVEDDIPLKLRRRGKRLQVFLGYPTTEAADQGLPAQSRIGLVCRRPDSGKSA